jgi:hypothetical protein
MHVTSLDHCQRAQDFQALLLSESGWQPYSLRSACQQTD